MWNRRKTVIIAGCSRFGASLAGEVSEHGNNVIVVEKDGGASVSCRQISAVFRL